MPGRHGQYPLPAAAGVDDPGRDRPEILQPPEHPQVCCAQQTITVPPGVLAKTAQKHDYPSAAWRRSYSRRTGAERGFATVKDPAASDIARGWRRLTGLAPLMLFTTTLLITRNQRASCAPGTPGRRKPGAVQPPGCPRKPANAAARPSPASAPDRPDPNPQDHDHETHTRHHSTGHDQAKHALTQHRQQTRPRRTARRPRTRPWTTNRPECQTQT